MHRFSARYCICFDPPDGSSNIDCGVSIGTLVLSTGSGVNGFTLDPSLGEFILTHLDIKILKMGKIYSVNEGNAKNWDAAIAKFVEKGKYLKDGSPPKSLRYIGSTVADVHCTLLYGGVFLSPFDSAFFSTFVVYAMARWQKR
ncbi:fructose-1,6-bisphosphatase, cytosolic-like isoform X1 [Panicum virgatum]|uniref:fructose-1,6-bisphosphatase, cytosolic-like isoform X1 n=1 Tax=Panicum virgatum TaxID=38727 RepID=UPI0019D5637F|nr:fructose-1,6-bisphosphatase, cytosolic-like isoform X1 [Panicum virgatum]XP_039831823.1 fructose-1,6-bisphosphatase, cytosolic-like isoform X1 [Panicum virgatum]XP_039831824.1 fructose-1,6-bisphosphatase, cytosolic-like isoform X1 [Panicum virgatum]XP_039831825.1 fructose-1,6-bisphosphatase, cytosolic-like isoform X1 [Panicum virgatum]XP_039831826.1 fructose-1,6-bisphosphatase, cytosolic-like isoform X1 [Panicum virgatum]XP_039831828.1 fructose-1,6-bisphosphatase, cytosolic-like isoform X1 